MKIDKKCLLTQQLRSVLDIPSFNWVFKRIITLNSKLLVRNHNLSPILNKFILMLLHECRDLTQMVHHLSALGAVKVLQLHRLVIVIIAFGIVAALANLFTQKRNMNITTGNSLVGQQHHWQLIIALKQWIIMVIRKIAKLVNDPDSHLVRIVCAYFYQSHVL